MLVFFTFTKKYSASETLFDKSISEIAGDDLDELFLSKNSCTSHDCRIGEYFFVRQLKLIWQKQKINVKKQPQTSKNQLSSTVSLLCALFENL
jgi:hypothetical protein